MTKIEEIFEKYSDVCWQLMDWDEFQQAAEELLKPLEAENTELKKQLEQCQDELNNSLASTDHFAGELEKAMKVIHKTNLYAELGKLVVRYLKSEWNDGNLHHIRVQMDKVAEQIKELGAGNEK